MNCKRKGDESKRDGLGKGKRDEYKHDGMRKG